MGNIRKLEQIKEKISNGLPSLGSWCQIPSPISAEIIASSDTFEWVTIDLEHSPISIETCENMIRAIDQSGSVPIVRLSSNNETQIKRVLDSGALGIIVPNTSNLKDVHDAYNAMHYPPIGKRGVGLARAQAWGRNFEKYKDNIDKETLLIAQIENKDAAENIDEIFGSGYLDAYIVGPYDLSASFGYPGDFEKSEFRSALRTIEESAKKHDIPSGYHLVEPDPNELEQLINRGYLFIAYSMDTVMLSRASVLNAI